MMEKLASLEGKNQLNTPSFGSLGERRKSQLLERRGS
jgi:hypothetical protein